MTRELQVAGAPEEMITVTRPSLMEAVVMELREAFTGSPYGDLRLSESQARWIASGIVRRAALLNSASKQSP